MIRTSVDIVIRDPEEELLHRWGFIPVGDGGWWKDIQRGGAHRLVSEPQVMQKYWALIIARRRALWHQISVADCTIAGVCLSVRSCRGCLSP